LWVAHYLYCTSGPNCCPTMPSGWTSWVAWQWSDKGTVSGVGAASVDLDLFYGDMNDLIGFVEGDGGTDGGKPPPTDAGIADAGKPDAGKPPVDAGAADAGSFDAGDAAIVDA